MPSFISKTRHQRVTGYLKNKEEKKWTETPRRHTDDSDRVM